MRTKQHRGSISAAIPVGGAYIPSARLTNEGQNPSYPFSPQRTWTPPPPLPTTTSLYTLPTPSSPPYMSSPPPLVHSRSPYANIPLPPILPYEEGEPILNSILEPGSTLSTMGWDVGTSPSNIVGDTYPRLFPSRQSTDTEEHRQQQNWHDQPAASTYQTSIVIRTAAFGDRPIVVFPSETNSLFITVYDVLDAVHRAARPLRVELDDEQSPSRKGNQSLNAGASLLFKRPSSRGSTGPSHRGPGFDDAAVRQRWGGLTASVTERDVWILTLY